MNEIDDVPVIEIRKKIEAGINSLQAGQGVPSDFVWAKLEEYGD